MEAVAPSLYEEADTILLCMHEMLQLKEATILLLRLTTLLSSSSLYLVYHIYGILALRHRGLPFAIVLTSMKWIQIHDVLTPYNLRKQVELYISIPSLGAVLHTSSDFRKRAIH